MYNKRWFHNKIESYPLKFDYSKIPPLAVFLKIFVLNL